MTDDIKKGAENMTQNMTAKTQRLMELLGHDESPLGVYYTDIKPEGFGPKPGEIFTREREEAGLINWEKANKEDFSCLMGNIWLARKKRKAAWISHEECGCPGGGFFSGMYRPYLESSAYFISTGIPGAPIEGQHYMPSPETMRVFMEAASPPSISGKYCVIKPLEHFLDHETPLVVVYFVRGEVLAGLHSLTGYATGNHNAVVSPFGAGCANIIAWPLAYQQQGLEYAVLGGFDPSARKYMKTDELTFALPLPLYQKMLDVMETSALTRHTWAGVRKKVMKSRRTWAEG